MAEGKINANVMVMSKSERIVGTWINGKAIYQKTLQSTGLNTADASLGIGLTNWEAIISIKGTALIGNGIYVPLPGFMASNSAPYVDAVFAAFAFPPNASWSPNTIYLAARPAIADNNFRSIWVTIQYTKKS